MTENTQSAPTEAKVNWCLGLLPAPNGTTQRCSRRDTCQRYEERHHAPNSQRVAQWLCPGRDSYWPAYVPMAGEVAV